MWRSQGSLWWRPCRGCWITSLTVNFSGPPCWLPSFLRPAGVFVSGPAVPTVSCNDSWTLSFVFLVHVLGFLWLHSTKPPPLEVDWEDYGSGNTLIQAIVLVLLSEVLTTASPPQTHTTMSPTSASVSLSPPYLFQTFPGFLNTPGRFTPQGLCTGPSTLCNTLPQI